MNGREWQDQRHQQLDELLVSANPIDEDRIAGVVPPVVGEAMLREITMEDRGSIFSRLLDPLVHPRARARATFLGVVGLVAVAVITLNLLSSGGLGSGTSEVGPAAQADRSVGSTGSAGGSELPSGSSSDLAGETADTPGADGADPSTTLAVTPSTEQSAVTESAPTVSPPLAEGEPDQTITTADACTAIGNNPDDAKATHDRECDEAWVDCGPAADDKWMCSSQPLDVQQGSSVITPTGACVVIETEALDLAGDWSRRRDPAASGGAYIVWEGLSPGQRTNAPVDTVTASIAITEGGSYRLVWASRQPVDADPDDGAGGTWIDAPDAARFGPDTGGGFSGPIRLSSPETTSFEWEAVIGYAGADRSDDDDQGDADDDDEDDGQDDDDWTDSEVVIDFSSAGVYTLEIAGGHHGQQLDVLILHRDSVTRSDAIAGRCG